MNHSDLAVDVVIVNWNTGDQLRACVASLPEAQRDGVRIGQVVVVDNASSDGSAEGLDAGGVPLHLVRSPVNQGFAAACNEGARHGQSPYVLFLNPDTRLFPTSLAPPLHHLNDPAHADVGICGVQLVDDDGHVARSSARFPTARDLMGRAVGADRWLPALVPPHFMEDWDHGDTRAVDEVIGAFFLVRRSLFDRLGGFDERFFVYYEELDFSLRARQAGFATHFVATAQAYHRGEGASSGAKAARLYYSVRSRIAYVFKHFPARTARLHVLVSLVGEPAARVALFAARGDRASVRESLRAYRTLWSEASSLLRGRVGTGPGRFPTRTTSRHL